MSSILIGVNLQTLFSMLDHFTEIECYDEMAGIVISHFRKLIPSSATYLSMRHNLTKKEWENLVQLENLFLVLRVCFYVEQGI
jgi:hypothetical protein